eukprot:3336743-Pyramimonas_sp.AAC.1
MFFLILDPSPQSPSSWILTIPVSIMVDPTLIVPLSAPASPLCSGATCTPADNPRNWGSSYLDGAMVATRRMARQGN